ncbi:MAG TPA: TolC family protein [Thermoanaerobaculia bacterium]|nr:TolC family protein [Thermoanaerobaculia bacterium]
MTAVRRLALLLCLAATPVAAQKSSTNEKPAKTPLATDSLITADRDAQNPRALKLSLDSAIGTAVQRNLGVELQRFDYRISGYTLRSAYGLFDPLATADLLKVSNNNPVTSPFFTSGSDRTLLNFGVRQFLPTGGNYAVGFNSNRSESVGGGTFINPAYNSELSLEANQPLLRNFGVDVNRRQINIARNSLGISQEAFRTRLINTSVSVEDAYLDLIYARQVLDVAKQSLFLATDQERITRIRIDVGASAPLDILQPRVAVATREEELIAAQALVRDAEDRLRQLMNLDPAEWDRPILPTDSVGARLGPIDLGQAVATALELRPELRQLKLGTDIREIEYTFARNQTLPQLDLNVSYGAAGLGGRSAEIDPVTGRPTGRINRTTYSNALEQVFGNEFASWTVGLNVGIPITNIGARSDKKRAELALERARADEETTKQIITVEVRKAVRDIETAANQITASRAARDAAEKNLDAERKRYENGMTTNFNVLLIQQQLSDSRVRELQALVFYDKAVSNYHRAIGDLLDEKNIAINEEVFESPRSRLESVPWLQFGNYDKK